MTRRFAALAAVLGASFLTPAAAQDLRIGWQQIVEPSRVAQATGAYEAETGAKVSWSLFGAGADVIAALASGSVDVAYIGSSPITVAASRELPIEVIYVVGNISSAEALAVRDVAEPKDLAGKTVATPFASTAHYSLLTALGHWGLKPSDLRLVNLRPQEIAAAWERGDIQGAYVWDPVLSQIKGSGGKVLADSADVAGWGGPTFDGWVVRKEYAEANPEIVAGFVRATGAATDAYLADPEAWTAGSEQVKAIAELTGASPEEVPALLKGYEFVGLKDQAGEAFLGGGTAKAIADTAAFLVEQGSFPSALADYAPYVNADYARQALRADQN